MSIDTPSQCTQAWHGAHWYWLNWARFCFFYVMYFKVFGSLFCVVHRDLKQDKTFTNSVQVYFFCCWWTSVSSADPRRTAGCSTSKENSTCCTWAQDIVRARSRSLPLNAAATYTSTKTVNPKDMAMETTLELSSRQSVGVAAERKNVVQLYICKQAQ